MIQIDLTCVTATARLEADQTALSGVPDSRGPAEVEARGSTGWSSLRPQLWDAQHGKCAYCEYFLREVANEVDHIRPKDARKYWWLAFSLQNLLLACRTCNNAKRSQFDLLVGVKKLRPRQEPWMVAEPAMLVDPTAEEPSHHITYVYKGGAWRIAAANDSARGLWTVEHLKLDRGSFSRAANRFIRLVVDPLAVRLHAAVAARDRDAIRSTTAALAALTRVDQEWTQLSRVVVSAVRDGRYPVAPAGRA